MRESIEKQLDDILNSHIDVNTELQQLVRAEREYIIHNELEKLEAVNQKKLELKEAIATLEERREPLMQAFRKNYALSKNHIRLEDLIAIVPEPYRSRYRAHRERLKKVLHAIKITHDGNRLLMRHVLNFHERSFQLLFGLAQQQLGYGKSGEMTHKRKRIIDSVV